MSALSDLDHTISSVLEKNGEETVFCIQGDMNISERNTARAPMLSHFLSKHSLSSVCLTHPSYHHFMGNGGEFDSSLDVLLFSSKSGVHEEIKEQFCRNEHPLVISPPVHSWLAQFNFIVDSGKEESFSFLSAGVLE